MVYFIDDKEPAYRMFYSTRTVSSNDRHFFDSWSFEGHDVVHGRIRSDECKNMMHEYVIRIKIEYRWVWESNPVYPKDFDPGCRPWENKIRVQMDLAIILYYRLSVKTIKLLLHFSKTRIYQTSSNKRNKSWCFFWILNLDSDLTFSREWSEISLILRPQPR